MYIIDYEKYMYIIYHLKSLLREWKKLKPNFEAKLATVHRMSPQAKSLHILSLERLSKRIRNVNSELNRFLEYVKDICKVYTLDPSRLIYKPNTGVPLYYLAGGIADDISLLQRKFKDGKTLPFKDFPYEFQSRLVALLPHSDLINFKLAGKTAAKFVDNRGQFSVHLFVARDSKNYGSIKKRFYSNPIYDITSTSYFLKSDRYYVRNYLCLNMNSTEKFDRAMQIVCGTYTGLELHGPFTWKHAVYFMNLHEEVSHVCLGYGMQLEAEDDDDFFEAVVQWLLQKKVAAMIDIQCPDLMDGFDPHLKECVENRTTYNVKFVDGWTIIFQQPQKP